ncbi:hypothetical protein BBP40_004296 [Aspergillus hancockii]|nr:hypothetical protein BBP40_004296 [Aspergillus hancockii]
MNLPTANFAQAPPMAPSYFDSGGAYNMTGLPLEVGGTVWTQPILAYSPYVDPNSSAMHIPLQQENAMGAAALQPPPQAVQLQRMSSTEQPAQQPAPSQPEQQDTTGPSRGTKTRALSRHQRETLKRRAPQRHQKSQKNSRRSKQQVQGHNEDLQKQAQQFQQQVLRLVRQLVPQIQQQVRQTQEQSLQVEKQVQQTQEQILQAQQQIQQAQERVSQVEKQVQQLAQQTQGQALQVQQTQGQVLQVQQAQEQILQVQRAYEQILQQEVCQQVLQQAHFLQQKNQESVIQMQQAIKKEAKMVEQRILRNMAQFVDPFLMARNQRQGNKIEELEAKVEQLEQDATLIK